LHYIQHFQGSPVYVKCTFILYSFQFETEDPRWNQDPLKLRAESYISVNHHYLYIDLHPDSSVVEVGQYINIDVFFHYRDYLSLKTFSYQVK